MGGTNAAALDQSVHIILTEKEIYETMVKKEKKSERLLKSQTLNLMIIDRNAIEELKTALPKLGQRRVDINAIFMKSKLSDFGEYKQPGKRRRVDEAEELKVRESKKIKV